MKITTRILCVGLGSLMYLGMTSAGFAQGQGTVVHYPSNVVHSQAVVTSSTVVPKCNCGCGSSSGCIAKPDCKLTITPSNNPGKITCERYPWTPPSPNDCECVEVKIDFYDQDVDKEVVIDLPKKIKKCVETYKFERMSFDVCGCKVSVCVPCQVCCTETSGCTPEKTTIKVRFRHRTLPVGGAAVYDVWADNVKGLPNPAVLGVELTAAQARTQFGVDLP